MRAMWRGWLVIAAAAIAVAACGLEQHDSVFGDDEPPAFSAERLGRDDGPLADDVLTPAEREAVARQQGEPLAFDDGGFDGARAADQPAAGTEEPGGSEKAGKMALSFLTVAITLGMAAAPYLLF